MTQDTLLDTLKTKPLSQLTPEEMREARELALMILRADYFGDVRGTAELICFAIAHKEVTTRDELSDRIDGLCNDAERVIYTAQAMECLLFSPHDDAYIEDFGDEIALDVKQGTINWSTLASCAFKRDVIEQLEAEGVDVDSFGESDDEPDTND
jgi:hypothetical protein